MACHLRVYGADLDVDDVMRQLSLPVADAYKKGELRNRASRVRNEASGISILISDADFDQFDRQLSEAQAFVENNKYELRQLVGRHDAEQAFLDFGVAWRGHAAQFWPFPPDFISLLGELGLGLEISHYPV